MTGEIRIGFIGAGRYTRRVVIPSLAGVPEFRLEIVSNRTEESSAAAAAQFGIARTTTHWQEVIDSPAVDAVMIGTPPLPHKEIALAALGAGKHVLCQPRMAATLDDARAMAEAARASGAQAMLVPPDYYVRGRRYVGHLLATGAMGQIREVLSQRSMPTVIDPHADLAARQDAKMFGVINPLHLGLYWDVLAPWFGQPVRVLAHSTIFVPRRRHPDTGRLSAVELPDAITVIAEMESGATVLNSQSGVAVAGDNKIVIHGEEATLVYELASEQLFLARRGETELRPMDVPAEFEYRQRIGPDFAELLMTGSQPQGSTFDDGLRNIEYLTACYLSARTGRSVSMSELAEPGSVDLLSAQSPA